MFWFVIVILVLMILLGIIGAIAALKVLRFRESSGRDREARLFLTALADILISAGAIGAVATRAFGPLETLIAAWALVVLIYLASLK